ncbi:hypothetical protein FA15DRAFT_730238, partial [Coprinopsis marcescibilis]
MELDPLAYLPILNFTWDLSLDKNEEANVLYRKVWCAKPPEDECILGACPNTDVSGIGSQVSTYITALVYAIVLLYIPMMGRPMLYAHLSVIYSLMIAVLVCMLRNELTMMDSVFVVICVVSPATLWLWGLTLASLWNPDYFPIYKEVKRKSKEIHALRLAVIGSFVFEIVLIALVFGPHDHIFKFSQPVCYKEIEKMLWYGLAWFVPLVMQFMGSMVILGLAMGVSWLWTSRRAYQVPEGVYTLVKPDEDEEKVYTRTPRVDLITWTERILLDVYPEFM